MRTGSIRSSCLLALMVSGLSLAGPLSPPAGPVASTGKTLTEVEPRTIVNAVNTPGDANADYVISQPGSYYLAGHLVGSGKATVVSIKSSDVTLDLNGFSVTATTSEYVMGSTTIRHITVRNGSIIGGSTNGISMSTASGVHLVDLMGFGASESEFSVGSGAVIERCTSIGAGSQGFAPGPGSVVRDCTVLGTGDNAFELSDSVAENCSALNAGGAGFSAVKNTTLRNCTATNCNRGFAGSTNSRFEGCTSSTSTHEGIDAGSRAMVVGCTVDAAGGDGIVVADGSVVRDNNVNASTGHGISAGTRCVITANNCSNNGAASPVVSAAGIYIVGTRCRVEDNTVTGNDWGIRIAGTGNLVIRNKASGNTTINYNSVSGNSFGVIVSVTVSPSIASNSSGGGLGTTDPNANLSY